MNENEFDSRIYSDIFDEIHKGQCTSLEDFFVNHKDRIHDLFDQDVMHVAAMCNNVKAVKMFLDAGFSPDACTKNSPTYPPLTAAVIHNSLEVINLLVDTGADIHYHKNCGIARKPPYIAIAARDGNLSLVKFFYERGVDINDEYTCGSTHMNA
ncbi:MAG: ankyrin repeat domain-containing protein [Planctomycetaceae bacterium]|jgi:ankyrin repeat protein|nr:ankyrin repeat domain-containing protein [Planctomycetaceae bacterium]